MSLMRIYQMIIYGFLLDKILYGTSISSNNIMEVLWERIVEG